MPTFRERQELAKQFSSDVARMHRCLETAGFHSTIDQVVRAWADYSDSLCATWLVPPDDDTELLETLLKYRPSSGMAIGPNIWRTHLIDVGDGSGGAILELPDDLIAQLGWNVGEDLTISETDSGELIIRRTRK